jgi:hypothetical protein
MNYAYHEVRRKLKGSTYTFYGLLKGLTIECIVILKLNLKNEAVVFV